MPRPRVFRAAAGAPRTLARWGHPRAPARAAPSPRPAGRATAPRRRDTASPRRSSGAPLADLERARIARPRLRVAALDERGVSQRRARLSHPHAVAALPGPLAGLRVRFARGRGGGPGQMEIPQVRPELGERLEVAGL